VRGLTLSAHTENAVSWETWVKGVCRFAYAAQPVVLAELCRETAPFGAGGRKFFHQDCRSTFLKCSSTLLGFADVILTKGIIMYSPNCWR